MSVARSSAARASRLRAALYHRVSTADQDPDAANDHLLREARARGLQVVANIRETGSGARNDRPGLLRLLELVRLRHVEIVLVWKLDRFGRSARDLVNNLHELERRRVQFVAVTQGIELYTGDALNESMGRLQVNMLAAWSEYERDLIVERTRLGLDRARRQGVRLGRPRDDNAPDPARVAELKGAGLSWRQIADELGCTRAAARRAFERFGTEGK